MVYYFCLIKIEMINKSSLLLSRLRKSLMVIQILMKGQINIDIGLNILLKQDLLFVINRSVRFKSCKAKLSRLRFPVI